MDENGSAMKPRIRAVIFDLDNCLAPADQVGRDLFMPAFEAIRKANDGKIPAAQLEAALEECWIHPFDYVATANGFSAAMFAAGWEKLSQVEVRRTMQGYGDLELLGELSSTLMRFLVTSGFRKLQESKVAALAIQSLFLEVFVDAIDEPGRGGKHSAFSTILERHRLGAEETLVVGDNPKSEIAVGNSMGMPTVQILRPGVVYDESATYHIANLQELAALLNQLTRVS